MPDVLWTIFQQNRRLLDDLPAIGAGVLQDRAEEKYGARVMILVVRHTFGAHLNFNAHLHILVSTVGLHKTQDRLVPKIRFCTARSIVKKWRHTLLDYLNMALESGLLSSEHSRPQLEELFQAHRDRLWIGEVDYFKSKGAFLRYISRYLRRPPLAEYRLLPGGNHEVRFLTKDKKLGREPVTTACTTHEFIARLAEQVPDRYRHGVRYFGLLAPQSIGTSYEVFLALLGQRRPPRPKRIPWAASIQKTFGQDPLLDSDGQRMYWVGRVSPAKTEPI